MIRQAFTLIGVLLLSLLAVGCSGGMSEQSSLGCSIGTAISANAMYSSTRAGNALTVEGATHRILDGNPDAGCQYPNIVMLRLQTNSGAEADCSGSLISPTVVLSAAHCYADPQIAPVRQGYVQVGNNLIQISGYQVYPTYSSSSTSSSYGNDLSVTFLSQPVNIAPVQLANGVPPVGSSVIAVGYGLNGEGSDGNGSLGLRLIGQLQVQSGIGTGTPSSEYPDSIVAVGRQETCEGDSGGPLIFNNEVVGVLSGGDVSNNLARCIDSSNSVYTPVAPYLQWLQSQVSSH